MTYLALAAAATMSAADPNFDQPQIVGESVTGSPPVVQRWTEREPAPYVDARQAAPSLPFGAEDEAPIEEDEAFYPLVETAPTTGEEYWTFDGTGTIPLRYGVETPEGGYEYDLTRDELTFRLRNP
jgi:hypothetical protein